MKTEVQPAFSLEIEDTDIPIATLSIWGATADNLKDFLRQIAALPKLDAGEELELAKQVEAGVLAEDALNSKLFTAEKEFTRDLIAVVKQGQRAKTRLIEGNMSLVVKTAKRNEGQGLSTLELIQEGSLGLAHAVAKFDYRRGAPFAGFAWFWIQQAMARAVMMQGRTIRLPVHVGEAITQLQNLRAKMLVELEREPSDTEIAQRMGISEQKVRDLKAYMLEPISFNTPITHDGDSLGEIILENEDDELLEIAMGRQLREKLEYAMAWLTARESYVISKRFGLSGEAPKTLEEIGEDLGVTRERVRQIEAKAMSKLKDPELARALQGFLD